MRVFFFFLLLTFCSGTASFAETTAQDTTPVEITAKESLSWDRNARTYTASGDVLAKQGNFSVNSSRLTAHYDDSTGASDIRDIRAEGNVVLSSPPYTAYGDEAIYTLATKHAILTGGSLKISTPTETLTARDKIEFFGDENRLTATGAARAVRGTDTLSADTLSAYFKTDAQNNMALERITAENNVMLTTARETVTGDSGVYNVVSGKAEIRGAVRIRQGESFLEGTRAEIDIKTGVSRLFAENNPATEGRVKGIFYPKQKNP